MMAIWKFKLEPGETIVHLPKTTGRHHFLHAGIDAASGEPAIWVRVHKLEDDDPNVAVIGTDPAPYKVLVLPTGIIDEKYKYIEDWEYLGTVHQHVVEHAYEDVWHIFVQPGCHKVSHGH